MFLEIKSKHKVLEFLNAYLDFIENRPILKFAISGMNALCCLMLAGNLVKWFSIGFEPNEIFMAIFCFMWIFFRRKINLAIIKRTGKHEDNEKTVHITNKYISYSNEERVRWSHLKKIYKNDLGFIIPMLGLKNAGKFIWLPYECINKDEQKTWLNLLDELKISIKSI